MSSPSTSFHPPHLPHRRGVVGAERPLSHQSGAITALKPLHRRNTQQIIVVLHGGSQRGPGIFHKQVACHTAALAGADVVHDLLHRLFFQVCIGVHRNEMFCAHPLQSAVERVGLSFFAAAEILQPAAAAIGIGLLQQNLPSGAVGGSVVHHQQPDAAPVPLVQHRPDGPGDLFFLVVGAHDHRDAFGGIGILPHLSVQQVRKEHAAHQKTGQQGDAPDDTPHIPGGPHCGQLAGPENCEPERHCQPQKAKNIRKHKFGFQANTSSLGSIYAPKKISVQACRPDLCLQKCVRRAFSS